MLQCLLVGLNPYTPPIIKLTEHDRRYNGRVAHMARCNQLGKDATEAPHGMFNTDGCYNSIGRFDPVEQG